MKQGFCSWAPEKNWNRGWGNQYFDGIVQDCSNSIANALELLQPCTKPSTLQWRYNEHDGVSNHQHHDCLLNRLSRRGSKKASKFRVTGLCVGNSPVTGEFPAQRASNAENVSIWWRHHGWDIRTSLTVGPGEPIRTSTQVPGIEI